MKLRGFTIVELLIVIVVIAIIAAISIVAYTGTTQKATVASIQSDLINSKSQIELFYAQNGAYPTANNCPSPNTTEVCLNPSSSTTFTYYPSATNNPNSYSLIASNNSNQYYVTKTTGPTATTNYVTSGLVLNIDASSSSSYPGTGNAVTDLTGLNTSITSYDTPLLYNDSSFDFSPSYTDGLNLAGNNFAGLTNFSMEAVFKVSGTHSHYSGALITSGDWNVDHWSFGLWQDNTSVYLRKFGGNVAVANNFAVNYWYDVIIVRNGTTLSCYVNGIKKPDSGVTNTALVSNATNTAIGRETYAGGYFNLNGKIAIARIYNRALSDSEAAQNYNAARSRYGI